ncbi:MAG: TatD family hydrolase [Planctomycetes bacterium]|nr:TatD family hydrolase [Planctomycetota bacterium]
MSSGPHASAMPSILPPLVDAHCHLYYDSYAEDRDAAWQRALAAGVVHALQVGTDVASSRAARELARRLGPARASATCGIHPHEAKDGRPAEAWEEFEALAREGGWVAIGESGLDTFKEFSPLDDQRELFRRQARLAAELDLPLVVHTRDAHEETAAILRAERGSRQRTMIHCFTGGPREAEAYLELGCHISFSGVLTYKKNEENRAAARLVPEERLLIETDAPFLAPEPLRGKRNEPAFLTRTFATLCGVRGAEPAPLAQRLLANTRELFRLPPLAP